MALLGSTREEEVGDSGAVGLLNGIHDRFAGTEFSVRTAPVTIGTDGLILDHTLPQDERISFLLE